MTNEGPQLDFRQLNGAYRETWKQFCAEVAVLESLISDAQNESVLEGVKKRVARAERSYRENRDRLAQYMIANASRGPVRKASQAETDRSHEHQDLLRTHRIRLESLAYQFWQDGGRRQGNADADWYRAEALLHI
jgi:hypothetical protein